MILVDTSIWIDHSRSRDATLSELLANGRVLAHPFVIGELAMGTIAHRDSYLASLHRLPVAASAYPNEVLQFVARHQLFGTDLGYIDASLLAAVPLTDDAAFWTRDRRLLVIAQRLNLAWSEPTPS